jgi:hypothetical protein
MCEALCCVDLLRLPGLFYLATPWFHRVIISVLAALISFGVLLVFLLQYPFEGEVSVNPDMFEELVHTFDERDVSRRSEAGSSDCGDRMEAMRAAIEGASSDGHR